MTKRRSENCAVFGENEAVFAHQPSASASLGSHSR